MKNLLIAFMFLGTVFFAGRVLAYDPMVFDSTDNYLGGCQLTDKSEWTLKENLHVTTFQIWYYWDANETTLPVTVTKDGQEFASFTATRSSCDPYQKSWCNADYALNKDMPAGTYATKIPGAKQCLKPGGTGTVRLYGTKGAASPDITRTSPPEETKTRSGFARYWYLYLAGGLAVIIVIYFIARKK